MRFTNRLLLLGAACAALTLGLPAAARENPTDAAAPAATTEKAACPHHAVAEGHDGHKAGSCCGEGNACCGEGKACCGDGKACCGEGKACCGEGKACCSHHQAMKEGEKAAPCCAHAAAGAEAKAASCCHHDGAPGAATGCCAACAKHEATKPAPAPAH
jgi:hypothetical protein